MKLSPATRVAAIATGVIAAVYVVSAIVLNLAVSAHLAGQNDERLASHLAAARRDPATLSQPVIRTGAAQGSGHGDTDGDAAPVFLWSVNAQGTVTGQQPGCARASGQTARRTRARRRARDHREPGLGGPVPAEDDVGRQRLADRGPEPGW